MTHLIGQITDDAPLLVVAFEEEAKYLGTDHPMLITGVGKVNAAISLTQALASSGSKPSLIVNVGTAGGLRDGDNQSGLHVVSEVIQHDLDTGLLESLTGEIYGAPITLSDRDGVTLATGDTFVSDSAVREKLAQRATLVDMEGYAVAAAAGAFGIPIRMVKHVSDSADESATSTWRSALEHSARQLADWVHANIG
ncbi:nucleoside phosphorylase [Actinoplanes sp. TBRC 11911]|uniref:nucleosidase n=1 Tax=Actinoplanes sp. TBRC 11911 TaxID=2729386 RepID=UPI00145CADE9|nr:nucleosidase [Actinoplanes sp. TBRC 11911]NMO49674.1 nucleoside phosphorylase [Actinoplanes sp. TBRC 11911]